MHWLMMPFQRLTDFQGRSRRIEFWLFWLAALIVQMIASYFDAAASPSVVIGGMGPITLTVTMILIVPAAMVGIRRLHDIGRSGWWMLLFGLPYVGWLASVDGDASRAVVPAIALLLGAIALLVLLVQPGQAGENAYGPDPKGGIADDAKPH